jgi:hypothetical protein
MFERESLLRTGLSRGAQEELELLEDCKSGPTRFVAVVDHLPDHRRGFFLFYATEAEQGVLIRRPQS